MPFVQRHFVKGIIFFAERADYVNAIHEICLHGKWLFTPENGSPADLILLKEASFMVFPPALVFLFP